MAANRCRLLDVDLFAALFWLIFALLLGTIGHYIGRELHTFGFGGIVVFLFAASLVPILIGVFTPIHISNSLRLVTSLIFIVAFIYNSSIYVGASSSAYHFAIEHGYSAEHARAYAANGLAFIITTALSFLGPIMFWVKSRNV